MSEGCVTRLLLRLIEGMLVEVVAVVDVVAADAP